MGGCDHFPFPKRFDFLAADGVDAAAAARGLERKRGIDPSALTLFFNIAIKSITF